MPRCVPRDDYATRPFIPPEPVHRLFGDVDISVTYRPTPETEPDEIREQHIDDVRMATEVLGTLDVPTLSDWTTLPVWSVKRALAALGLIEFDAYLMKRKIVDQKAPAKDRIIAVLGKRDSSGLWPSMNARQLGIAVGCKCAAAHWQLTSNRDLFECEAVIVNNRKVLYWRLRNPGADRAKV
jgi:hypothetical protein